MSEDQPETCSEEQRLFIEMISEDSSFDDPVMKQFKPSADDYEWGLQPSPREEPEPREDYLDGKEESEYPHEQDNLQFIPGTSKCFDKNLGTIAQYPEIKFKGLKCYRRTRKIVGTARVCYPSNLDDKVENALKECLIAALVVAAPFVLTGALPAAYAIFKSTLAACLKSKGIDLIGKVTVKLGTTTIKTRWKRC